MSRNMAISPALNLISSIYKFWGGGILTKFGIYQTKKFEDPWKKQSQRIINSLREDKDTSRAQSRAD